MPASQIAAAPSTTDITSLSPGALQVLGALLESSDGNGDDFGFMGDAFESLGLSSQAFAGHVAHLGAFIEWREDLAKDRGVQCDDIQFGLTEECIAARSDVERRLAPAPLCCPTEAQVVAILNSHSTSASSEVCRLTGCSLLTHAQEAVAQETITWRELMDEPHYAVATVFDDFFDGWG